MRLSPTARLLAALPLALTSQGSAVPKGPTEETPDRAWAAERSQITPPPDPQELAKREAVQTVLRVAGDDCGYVEGRTARLSNAEADCALFTSAGANGYQGICSNTECYPYTACVRAADCDDACSQNRWQTICKNNMHCATATYALPSADVLAFFCWTEPITSTLSMGTTMLRAPALAYTSYTTTAADFPSFGSPTGTASGGDGDTSGAAASTDTGDVNGGGTNNAGAIAGGVVGGLAVLSLAGLAALFILRRRKGPATDSHQPTPQATSQATPELTPVYKTTPYREDPEPTTATTELPATDRPQEVYGGAHLHEAP